MTTLTQSKKKDIRQITKDDLRTFFINNNDSSFKGSQVYEWLWKHRKIDFKEMTNLSISNRKKLNDFFCVNPIEIVSKHTSRDGTIKFLFNLHDNKLVEGVLIPQLNRLTACISSQVGCSLACDFCATGKLKSFRNLSVGEIYDQAFLINQYCIKKFKKQISNIVLMGMGEPLLNFSNVLQAVNHITEEVGMNMSRKRITLSSAGISKMIIKLADTNSKFNLAISLHSANDKKRSQIMDINKTNNLESLLNALLYFYEKTKIKPTYEYILLKGFNDSIEDAEELINFCRKVPSKVNLIEYNKVENVPYEKSTKESVDLFIETLKRNKILVKMRRSRGEDIGAACGQLATQKSSG